MPRETILARLEHYAAIYRRAQKNKDAMTLHHAALSIRALERRLVIFHDMTSQQA